MRDIRIEKYLLKSKHAGLLFEYISTELNDL